MASKDDVSLFLQEFFTKYRVFGIIFRDSRPKNAQTLLVLEITPIKRREIVESITVTDYSEGPLDDRLYGIASMWVFGKVYKNNELYIKISVGTSSNPVICISFHPAAHPINYPFKKEKT
ncbi:toxin [Parapedobacter indicus]|uniref:Toxin n=1 Tax=Parapedobacter indicus TaxID=1477437 RepID=A0A1I3VKP1_9SPHI|nr:toxin [Parapedobacter indicus]PPK98292.1 hypothetical protein CLV26_11730 [Parapedobacter indicus]SFJ94886.1 hypothetical protein SAMN05444682_11718 [Parapedobacter indicus]